MTTVEKIKRQREKPTERTKDAISWIVITLFAAYLMAHAIAASWR